MSSFAFDYKGVLKSVKETEFLLREYSDGIKLVSESSYANIRMKTSRVYSFCKLGVFTKQTEIDDLKKDFNRGKSDCAKDVFLCFDRLKRTNRVNTNVSWAEAQCITAFPENAFGFRSRYLNHRECFIEASFDITSAALFGGDFEELTGEDVKYLIGGIEGFEALHNKHYEYLVQDGLRYKRRRNMPYETWRSMTNERTA